MSNAESFRRAKSENEKAIIRTEANIRQYLSELPGLSLVNEKMVTKAARSASDNSGLIGKAILMIDIVQHSMKLSDKIRKVFTS